MGLRWRGARSPFGPAADEGDLDGILLVRSRQDICQFGEFYDRNQASILRYFVTQTRNPHLAAELTAETFAAALSSRHTYDPRRGTGMGWLVGIANHQYLQYVRRGAVDHHYRLRYAIPALGVSEDDLDHIDALADLRAALPSLASAMGRLSPAVRAAVELRVGHDLPYAEVAIRLGCSVGSARVRVARGMKQLVVAMGVEGAS